MQISMTIRARLTLLSVLAVLATSLLIGLFFLSNRANEKALVEVFEENSQSLVRMQRMELLLSEVRFRAAGVLLDQMPVQGARNHLKEARGELAELWRTLQAGTGALFGSEDSRELFATLQKSWPQVDQVLAELETGYQAGDNDAVTVVLEEQWAPLISGVVKPLQALIPLAQQRSASAYAEARAKSRTMLVAGMAVTGVLLACLIGVAVWTVRAILQPLNDVQRALQRVAEGDLAAPVPPARRDELGPLVAALTTMHAALHHLVTQVRAAADSIATTSAEVATGNADLSQRTEKAASSLNETVASMEQLGGAVSQSADTARQADAMASNAAQVASAGGAMVSDIVQTMQEIESSSRQISEIIGVIDGIAFQTNILALNAAVEAARAGEQGRGFAVVAGEVRNLASRSAEAARQIHGLIGTSVEKVQIGSALVTRTGGTMNDVVSSVQRVAQMIGEISNAGSEQTHGIAQVNTAVNRLDRMTQQNAALVEQSSAASASLKQQAHQLAELVSVFKLAHTA